MYVAVTRARKSLTLSWAQERKRQRQLLKQSPSRFIEEMGLNLLCCSIFFRSSATLLAGWSLSMGACLIACAFLGLLLIGT
ncbi:MAG: hypothetical protein ACKO19_00870 [Betaproteobacteria bacterium]